MAISKKRKREIEKEEKYRAEVKRKLEKETKPTKDLLKKEWWTSYSGIGIRPGCLIPILVIAGLVTLPFGVLLWILGAIIWLGSRKKR